MATRRVSTQAEVTVEEGAVDNNATETVTASNSTKATASKKVVSTASKPAFDASEPIMCTSVTAGELIMIGKKTKNVYTWANYGDSTEVEYQDLQAAKLTKSQYIFSPLFMIENDELLEAWPDLQEMYSKMYNSRDISELFKLDNATFKRTLTTLPVGIKNTLKTMAYVMVENGTLDSLKKIRIMDDVLGTDIMALIKE